MQFCSWLVRQDYRLFHPVLEMNRKKTLRKDCIAGVLNFDFFA
jgi:hypothetical protein